MRQTLLILGALFGLIAPVAAQQNGPPILLHSAIGAGVPDSRAHDGMRASGRGTLFVGRLERVQKNNGRSKRWALIDDDNQVAAFVAPTTKYDLRQLLGKEIGITARTFSEPEGEPPYVMIESLTRMTASDWDSRRHVPESRNVLAAHTSEVTSPVDAGAEVLEAAPVEMEHVPHQYVPEHHAPVQHEPQHWDGYEPESDWRDSGPGDAHACGQFGGCSDPHCHQCGGTAYVSNIPLGAGTCGPPGWMWFRGENIQWWSKGMDAPPLVTTSTAGTPASQAGVLGLDSTSIIYGNNNDILTDAGSGFRISYGGYFGPERRFGYEGDFFSITDHEDKFVAKSDANGSTIYARPFFNINPRVGGSGDLDPPARQDAELVSYPNLLRGTVQVNTSADLRGASFMTRWNKCCKQSCCCPDDGCGACGGDLGSRLAYGWGLGLFRNLRRCGYPASCRLDFLVGYQYMDLKETLHIREDLTSLDANNLGTFEIDDIFVTKNEFNGAILGTAWESGVNRWTLDLMMKMAIGTVDQTVNINGQTTISPLLSPAETYEGGLLAQRSNIGGYNRSRFTMIPQLNTNLGFYLTPHMRFMFGYTLIYWGNVVRPGEHIDLDVNPDLLPEELSNLTGPLRPEFSFNDTDYWIHGINLGLDYRW